MAVAEGRMYNLRHMFKDELAINAYLHLCNWVDYASQPLNNISKKVLKTNDAATGYEKVGAGWGKKMSEQVFIYLLKCSVRGLDRDGKEIPGYVTKHWTNSWFTSHTFRRAGTKYRFMYAQHARRWSLCMINWWAGWGVSETSETLVRYCSMSRFNPKIMNLQIVWHQTRLIYMAVQAPHTKSPRIRKKDQLSNAFDAWKI
ncbi:hypothetical protein F442_20001 [Phytophthora nicotianae P10297]|uniref:Uncharacterized protein n=1 Tax=Phytophthora nicotianae P10297 TaxID=1317064 RepID=W2Y8Z3_PHYNI|nr:hypothetical protein F442_20001 [Phytophthora nicotianae P10297]